MRMDVRWALVEEDKEWGLPYRFLERSAVKAARRDVEGRVVPAWSR